MLEFQSSTSCHLFAGPIFRPTPPLPVMRQAHEHQAFARRCSCCIDFFPYLFASAMFVLGSNMEGVSRSAAAKNVELAVDHLPRIAIAAPGDAVHDAVGAVAAVLRQKFSGDRSKRAICSRRWTNWKLMSKGLVMRRVATLVFTLGEVAHHVVKPPSINRPRRWVVLTG